MIRLFSVRACDVFEHPPHLPTDPARMPVGPVEGWEAYAFDFSRDAAVLGPFDPVIVRDAEGRLCIGPVPGDVRGEEFDVAFYYGNTTKYRFGECKRTDPMWHQSGTTLRFIRKREDS